VTVIGVEIDAIERGEDRIAFKETMNGLGIEVPKSTAVYSVEDAVAVAAELGYPVVVRPGRDRRRPGL
jgi:carbamoyl-phosphate synthase large subunit